MTSLAFFFGIFVALLVGAVALAVSVLLGRGRPAGRLLLSAVLILLAIGVWFATLREPPPF